MAAPGEEPHMLGRLGAILLIGGAVVSCVVVAIALSGGAVGLAERISPSPVAGELLSLVAIMAFGLGAGAVSIAGGGAFRARLTRVGLALVGIGFLSLAVGSILPSFFGMYPDEYPVLFLLLGFAVGALGSLLTGVAFSRSPGWLRLSALAMFVGFVLLILSAAGGTPVISEVYFVLFALSFAAIGVVALRAAPRQADA
jgi:hypothetical protein